MTRHKPNLALQDTLLNPWAWLIAVCLMFYALRTDAAAATGSVERAVAARTSCAACTYAECQAACPRFDGAARDAIDYVVKGQMIGGFAPT